MSEHKARTGVPLVDLYAQYLSIKTEVDAAIARAIETSGFIGGEQVRLFEQEFAACCGVRSCVGVANGTDALYLAMRAMGIGPGDEVITVAHTFVATAEAIAMCGATPVFVDVVADTMLMDPELIERAISPRTKAVLPVHLYGQPCDMDRINAVAKRHGLRVIEDAAQAHLASWRGRRVGGLADVACFSFYPGKNLGAYGDAGAVVSDDVELVDTIRRLANHGRKEKYTHDVLGVNSRLDAMQAAILRTKLRHLEGWTAARRLLAARFIEGLQSNERIRLTAVHPHADPVWHLFVVRVEGRDELQRRLRSSGIETGVHYPLPLHLQPAFASLGVRAGALPVSENAAQQVVSLPLYPELSPSVVDRIVDELRRGW